MPREAFEERAAILEFDAGVPRAEAERQARLMYPLPDQVAEVDKVPPGRRGAGYGKFKQALNTMKKGKRSETT